MKTPAGLKRCPECRLDFPPTGQFFYRCIGRSDGLQARCKLCDSAHGRKDCRRRRFVRRVSGD